MTVRNANFTAFIDAFTNNTFVMVIMGPDSADIGTSLRRPRERHTRGREWGLGWSWACVCWLSRRRCAFAICVLPRDTLQTCTHSFTLRRALSYHPPPPPVRTTLTHVPLFVLPPTPAALASSVGTRVAVASLWWIAECVVHLRSCRPLPFRPCLAVPAAEPGAIQLNIQMASKLFETYVRESA